MESKVLLKDLPFAASGTIIDRDNGGFSVDRGETLYDGSLFCGASNGTIDFSDNENELIYAIWDNPLWFSGVIWRKPKWSVGTTKPMSISIIFDSPVPQRDLIKIAKGVSKTLSENYKATVEGMGWTNTNLVDIDFDGRGN